MDQKTIQRIASKETHIITSSGILQNISPYLSLIGIQMLLCPIQIGSDLNIKEKLNAVPSPDEMNESIMVPRSSHKHRVINNNRCWIHSIYQLKQRKRTRNKRSIHQSRSTHPRNTGQSKQHCQKNILRWHRALCVSYNNFFLGAKGLNLTSDGQT